MLVPKEIYDKISKDKNLEWVEKDDRLYTLDEKPFDEKNQISWWEVNCRIRGAFNFLQKEIERELKANKSLSSRAVSWTRIAELAKCDRNTVKHSKRILWTSQKRETLLKKIKRNQENSGCENMVVEKEEVNDKSVVEMLKLKLEQSMAETARWVVKYQEAKDELNLLNRLISVQQEKANKDSIEIKELRARLKKMMQI
ncbi:hypothetical protein [Priestia sp. YIM B13448]|uniref:hypothetical protein n=1 Tax=Priestia sp. YIM B13448 TaxID=3366308 RepID=UPI00366B5ECF